MSPCLLIRPAVRWRRAFITDWMLPDMDGSHLIKAWQSSLGPALPPVLVISAYATADKRAEALAAGATAFVTKPVDEHKLRTALAAMDLGPDPGAAPLPSPQAGASYDFAALADLGVDEKVRQEFIGELEGSWAEVEQHWADSREGARHRVPRLRSQVLLVRADLAADQVRLLDLALESGWSDAEIAALVSSAGTEVRALLAAARPPP